MMFQTRRKKGVDQSLSSVEGHTQDSSSKGDNSHDGSPSRVAGFNDGSVTGSKESSNEDPEVELGIPPRHYEVLITDLFPRMTYVRMIGMHQSMHFLNPFLMWVMKAVINTMTSFAWPWAVQKKFNITSIRKMPSQQATYKNMQSSAGGLTQSLEKTAARMKRRPARLLSNH